MIMLLMTSPGLIMEDIFCLKVLESNYYKAKTDKVVSNILTSIFLNPDLDILCLKKYFNDEAWSLVLDIFKEKQKSSICKNPLCNEICFKSKKMRFASKPRHVCLGFITIVVK